MASLAPASIRMPYHAEVPLPTPRIVTGSAAVPLMRSSPSMMSSTSLVFTPEAWASLVATSMTVPGSMWRKAPAGTVTSPLTR